MPRATRRDIVSEKEFLSYSRSLGQSWTFSVAALLHVGSEATNLDEFESKWTVLASIFLLERARGALCSGSAGLALSAKRDRRISESRISAAQNRSLGTLFPLE